MAVQGITSSGQDPVAALVAALQAYALQIDGGSPATNVTSYPAVADGGTP